MISGKGSTNATLTNEDVRQLVAQACVQLPLDGKRVLVIIPDGTRTAPIPLFFRVLYEQLGQTSSTARLFDRPWNTPSHALRGHRPTGRCASAYAGRAVSQCPHIQPSLVTTGNAAYHRRHL